VAKVGKMMAQKILRHHHPVLITPTEELTEWNKQTHKHWQQMYEVVQTDVDAAAVAAPQVGCSARFFVWKGVSGEINTVINPHILYAEGKETHFEGCLSFPGVAELITRHKVLQVQYVSFPEWELRVTTLEGMTARIFQHEIDHLDGILLIDHMTQDRKNAFLQRYRQSLRTQRR
jgi:peptide deformylase